VVFGVGTLLLIFKKIAPGWGGGERTEKTKRRKFRPREKKQKSRSSKKGNVYRLGQGWQV